MTVKRLCKILSFAFPNMCLKRVSKTVFLIQHWLFYFVTILLFIEYKLYIIGLYNFLSYVLPQIIISMKVQGFNFSSPAALNHQSDLFLVILLLSTI